MRFPAGKSINDFAKADFRRRGSSAQTWIGRAFRARVDPRRQLVEAHAARDTVRSRPVSTAPGAAGVGLGGGPGPLCSRRLMGVAGPVSRPAVKSLPRSPRASTASGPEPRPLPGAPRRGDRLPPFAVCFASPHCRWESPLLRSLSARNAASWGKAKEKPVGFLSQRGSARFSNNAVGEVPGRG